MDFIYIFITLALVISTLVLGVILILQPIPEKPFLNKYKLSSRLLGIVYVLFASITIYILYIGTDKYLAEYFRFSTTIISATQAIVFSFALISLLNPHFTKRITTMYIVHASVILLFLLTYWVFTRFEKDAVLSSINAITNNQENPITILRFIFIIFYLYQFLHYLIVFQKSISKYNKNIENYYSEIGKIKLYWIRYAFYSSFVVALTALIFQIIPSLWFDILFSGALIGFYIVFALNFINYNRIFHIIEPALEQNLLLDSENHYTQKKSNWPLYRQRVLEKKIYLNEGITLIEMADFLNISRTTLSTLINIEENQSFNQWIKQLRVDEAKRLMQTNPNYSFLDIAYKTGFSEQSNFSREFKQITGETPSSWKKSINSLN